MDDKATVVSDIALPIEWVPLKHLKTRAGDPVMVRCENRDHIKFYDALESLPGLTPRDPVAEEAIKADPALAEKVMRENMAIAEPLIELCTSLLAADGSEILPAFWFDPSKPRHQLSIPGRLLDEEDKLAMLLAIMRVGGYLGGAAADATFPASKRKGPADGDGAAGGGETGADVSASATG